MFLINCFKTVIFNHIKNTSYKSLIACHYFVSLFSLLHTVIYNHNPMREKGKLNYTRNETKKFNEWCHLFGYTPTSILIYVIVFIYPLHVWHTFLTCLLPAQSQQWEHQNKVQNLFKVRSKGTRKTSVIRF